MKIKQIYLILLRYKSFYWDFNNQTIIEKVVCITLHIDWVIIISKGKHLKRK